MTHAARLSDDIESLLRTLASECTVEHRPPWIVVLPVGVALPEHGWKLHVSTRAADLPDLLGILVPVLLEAECAFKVVETVDRLTRLNDGVETPAAVGKAVTIYPPSDRVRILGLELVELLRGRVGPRILSDRRIAEDAPVYYRYGPIASGRVNGYGHPDGQIHGPGAATFSGTAEIGYRQPEWVLDPFTGGVEGPDGSEPESVGLVGDRYRIVEGLQQNPRGNVYRAIDEQTGRRVIVKQARALVAEHRNGTDARLRLRNERRILVAADGLPGIPRFIDHLQYGDDEYLVQTDQGALDLGDDLVAGGPYTSSPERSLPDLASRLARLILGLHDRGIWSRDVKPKNILLDRTQEPASFSLVDFGSAAFDGLSLPGGSLQYAPPRQMRGEEARDTDDLYALGMTLIEAMTGLPPVFLGTDALEVPKRRGIVAVRAIHGDELHGLPSAIVDLLSEDAEVARTALRRIADGETVRLGESSRVRSVPGLSPEQVAESATGTLNELLHRIDVLVSETGGRTIDNPSIATGYAGIGLELVHHLSEPGVGDRVRALAVATVDALRREGIGPGLFIGRTGSEFFLRTAVAHGVEVPNWTGERRFPDDAWAPAGDDLFEGHAGVGLAHLWLYDFDADPRDLEVAGVCATRLSGVTEVDGSILLAHGLGGVLEFQRAWASRSGEPADRKRAGLLAERLVTGAAGLVEGGNVLTTATWCNGLAGVSRALLDTGDPDLLEPARVAGEICADWMPRFQALGQCCGLAGVGDLMIDLAQATGEDRLLQKAYEVAARLLLRSNGEAGRPVFVEPGPETIQLSWAYGPAGILGFLRRLRDGGGPRILPAA